MSAGLDTPGVILDALALLGAAACLTALGRRELTRARVAWLLAITGVRLAAAACADVRAAAVVLVAGDTLLAHPVAIGTGPAARRCRAYLHLAVLAALAGAALAGPEGAASTATSRAGVLLIAGSLLVLLGAFPFQSWRPRHAELGGGVAMIALVAAPGPVTVLDRLAETRAPALGAALPALLGLLAVSSLYAAALACVQRDARRWLGWIAVQQWTLVAAALLCAPLSARVGGETLALGTALGLQGLAHVLLAVEARAGRLDVARHHGLGPSFPRLARAFLLTALAVVGFPGTLGFAAHELVLDGMMVYGGLSLALPFLIALALAGVSALRVYFAAFGGPPPRGATCPDATPGERVVLALIVVAVLLFGLAPRLLVQPVAQLHTCSG